jgi:hypothetical protein
VSPTEVYIYIGAGPTYCLRAKFAEWLRPLE